MTITNIWHSTPISTFDALSKCHEPDIRFVEAIFGLAHYLGAGCRTKRVFFHSKKTRCLIISEPETSKGVRVYLMCFTFNWYWSIFLSWIAFKGLLTSLDKPMFLDHSLLDIPFYPFPWWSYVSIWQTLSIRSFKYLLGSRL